MSHQLQAALRLHLNTTIAITDTSGMTCCVELNLADYRKKG